MPRQAKPKPPETKIKRGKGRPTDYRPEFVDIARHACINGATELDLAQRFRVTTVTIHRWKHLYPDFCNSVKVGKAAFDDKIEMSLAHRAAGYSFQSEKLFSYKGKIIRASVIEHVPPDVNAAIFWLKNRKPDEWRERKELQIDVAFSRLTDEELQGKIEEDAQALGLPETAIEALLLTYEPEEKDGEGEK